METFKFVVFSVVILALVGIIGYWSFATIQSGSESQLSQRIEALQEENEELKQEVKSLSSELGALLPKEEPKVEEDTNVEPPPMTTYKYQDLINSLQKLVDDNIFMKLKSSGTRVGTVQEFLNIYNRTSLRIDNDYGPGVEKAVSAFQKDQGLSADGEAGVATFNKMIDWLKKQK